MKRKISSFFEYSFYSPITAFPLIFSGSALNLLFWWLSNDVIKSPIFMDSLFTAVAGALYGPWAGIFTGLGTNLLIEGVMGFPGIHWPFALCNMATGLIVGIMAKRERNFLFGLNVTLTIVMVVIANSLLGTLIAIFVFSGDTEVSLDFIVSIMTEFGQTLFAANFWSRILTNLIDKMIAVYTAFGLKRWVIMKSTTL
jgi:energy-coupling factor transport system substrate-specific component